MGNHQTDHRDRLARSFAATHHVIMTLAAILLIVITSVSFIYLYSMSKTRILKTIEKDFIDRYGALELVFGYFNSYVSQMKNLCEDDINNDEQPPPINRIIEQFETGNNEYFTLDRAQPLHDLAHSGNLFGVGSLDVRDPEYFREMSMALNLFAFQRASHQTIPYIVYSYYFSTPNMFLSIYPSVMVDTIINQSAGTDLKTSMMDVYQPYKDFAPFGIKPENRHFWTDPYLDRTGKGMMVSLVAPVFAGETYKGLVGADIMLNYLEEILASTHEGYTVHILATENQKVISTSAGSIDSEDDILTIDDIISEWKGGYPFAKTVDPSGPFIRIGDDYCFSKKLKSVPWTLYFFLRHDQLSQLLLPLLQVYIILVAVFLIFFVFAYSYIKNRFIKPSIKAQNNLALSEQLFRTIAELMPMPLIRFDHAHEFIYASESFYDMFRKNHSISNLKEWYLTAFPDKRKRDEAEQRLHDMLFTCSEHGGRCAPHEFEVVCRDGALRTMELFCALEHDGGIIIFHDLTARKKAEKEIREKNLRLENERLLAHKVQKNLLTTKLDFPGYDIEAIYRASDKVSGDFYDLWEINGVIHFVIGDVSGHGAASALLMAACKGMIRSLGQKNNDPGRIVAQINELLCQMVGESGLYLTLIYCVFHRRGGQMHVLNAGHNSAYLVRNERLVELPSQGCPLGWYDDETWDTAIHDFHAGEILFLYTDGLTEAKNSDGEEFGEERLKSLLTVQAADIGDLTREILAEAAAFASHRFDDDITILSINRKGE